MSAKNDSRRSGHKVSPRLYLIVGALLIALPLLGYFVSNWYTTRRAAKKRAEECFRQPLREFSKHAGGSIMSVAGSPDGRRAISGNYEGSDGIVHLWDLETGKVVWKRKGHARWVSSVAITPDGRWAVSGGGDRTVRLWDIETGETLREFEGHEGWVRSVAISPEGKRVLSGGSDKTLRLWDLSTERASPGTGKEILKLEGHACPVSSVAFSPDGKRALSGGGADGTVRLWNLERGEMVQVLRMPALFVTSVAVAPDGRRALSGSEDGAVRLWEIETGRTIREFKGHASEVFSVAFSPDGRHALSGGWRTDAAGVDHAELLLWRLPDELGFWLLGTKDE